MPPIAIKIADWNKKLDEIREKLNKA